MDTANEITVRVLENFESVKEKLLSQGFTKTEDFTLDDVYYIKEDTDLNGNILDIIKNAVLIRQHIEKDNSHTFLTAKKKEFLENGEILSQKKVDLEILNILDAENFLNLTGYKKLMPISAKIETYSKYPLGICIQNVNDKYLLIEVEENSELDCTKKLISALNETDIEYDKSNYFVKKAQIIFEEIYR